MKFSRVSILAAIVIAATAATASVERVDLAKITARCDDAVFGTILKKRVVRIDHPRDGVELYFTTLTIEGRSLRDDKSVTVDVCHMGGFVDATHGSFNSEAPAADDELIGNRVVVFYKYSANMGGDFAGNAIFGWHAGIYRTFERKSSVIVQGRGDGYAIPTNIALGDLDGRVKSLVRKDK
jgi:hypothetical protein